MDYHYFMTQRPPMPGAMPRKGLKEIIAYDPDDYIPEICHVIYAELVYDRELTKEEVSDYELMPKAR